MPRKGYPQVGWSKTSQHQLMRQVAQYSFFHGVRAIGEYLVVWLVVIWAGLSFPQCNGLALGYAITFEY